MKEFEMIIAKETKRGTRYYRMYRHRMMPVKKAEVMEMMAEGIITLVDEDRNIIWTPAVEEVKEAETVEVEEVETVEEVDNTVLDVTGTNYNDMNTLKERFMGNFNQLTEEIKGFIVDCDWFSFDGNSLLLYRGRRLVAEGNFCVRDGKIYLNSIGAGELFQWSRFQAVKEESKTVEVEIEGVSVEVKNIPNLMEQMDLSELKLGRSVNYEMVGYMKERAKNIYTLALKGDNEPIRVNYYKTYLRYMATIKKLEIARMRE